MNLEKTKHGFEKLINEITTKKINLLKDPSTEKSLYDFKESKENYYITAYNNSYLQLKKALQELLQEKNRDPKELLTIQTILKDLEISFQTNDLEGMKKQLAIISTLTGPLAKKFSINIKKIPPTIRDEIQADMMEL